MRAIAICVVCLFFLLSLTAGPALAYTCPVPPATGYPLSSCVEALVDMGNAPKCGACGQDKGRFTLKVWTNPPRQNEPLPVWHFDNRHMCDRVGRQMVSMTIGKPDYVFTFKKHICVEEREEVTRSYYGPFQQKYSCAGVDYSDMESLTPAEQIHRYEDWWNSCKIGDQLKAAGLDMSKFTAAQQAAILQGAQYRPNRLYQWAKEIANGNYGSRATLTPQDSALGDTSFGDMADHFADWLRMYPALYNSPSGPIPGSGLGAFVGPPH